MKPIWIVVISVILTGAVIGGGVYYYQNKKLVDAKKDLNNQITVLQTQVNNLKASSSTTTATPSTSTATPTTAATVSNIFDLSTAKTGDKVATMTIFSVKPYSMTIAPPVERDLSASNAKVVFSGQATIEGTYNYINGAMFGWDLSFTVSSASRNNLPVIKGSDDHQPAMGFSNKAQAMQMFGITENQAKSGTVKIIIQDYVINRYPTEITDTFALVSVQ